MIYAVAQGMDAMKFGAELTYSKMGVLCIGARLESQQEGLDRVCFLIEQSFLMYGKRISFTDSGANSC